MGAKAAPLATKNAAFPSWGGTSTSGQRGKPPKSSSLVLHGQALQALVPTTSIALRVAIDVASLLLALTFTKELRLLLGGVVFGQIDQARLSLVMPPEWLLLGLWLISAWWVRLYRRWNGDGLLQTAIQIAEAMALLCALTIVASFALYENTNYLSRAVIVLLFVVGTVTSVLLRAVLWIVLDIAKARCSAEGVIVVGRGETAALLTDKLNGDAEARTKTARPIASAEPQGARTLSVSRLDDIELLRQAINETKSRKVIAVDSELGFEDLAHCVAICSSMGIPLYCTGGNLTRFPIAADVATVGGVRLVGLHQARTRPVQSWAKRSMDILVSGFALLVLSPVLAVLAALITLTSPGPVFFVSDRAGLGGRHFRFLKFRSMVSDAEARRSALLERNSHRGHLFKVRDDPRITRVGRFMRRLSLDELPQLINVLRGDMSLVGPRPLPASDLDPDGLSLKYRDWSLLRARVRPGITGLWQVRGRSQLPFEEMVRLDEMYVQNWSIVLDARILLETVPAVISGRGAM